MKLNNKGFAITSVLYGLLILFVVLTSIFCALTFEMENSANVNSNIKTIFLSFIIITFFNVN